MKFEIEDYYKKIHIPLGIKNMIWKKISSFRKEIASIAGNKTYMISQYPLYYEHTVSDVLTSCK